MRVSEAFAMPPSAFGSPLELSGWLIVSSHLVCIVEDEAAASSRQPQPAILLNRDAIAPLFDVDLALYAGSSVSHSGAIELKGTVAHTGIALLPLYIPYVYSFSFTAEPQATHSFSIGDTYKNIHVVSRPALSTRALQAIKPLLAPQMPIVQFLRQFESRSEHLAATHVRGEELNRIVELIESAGFEWRIEETEIVRGQP